MLFTQPGSDVPFSRGGRGCLSLFVAACPGGPGFPKAGWIISRHRLTKGRITSFVYTVDPSFYTTDLLNAL